MVPAMSPEKLAVSELWPSRVEQHTPMFFRFADAWVRRTDGSLLSATVDMKDSSFIFSFGANFEK